MAKLAQAKIEKGSDKGLVPLFILVVVYTHLVRLYPQIYGIY